MRQAVTGEFGAEAAGHPGAQVLPVAQPVVLEGHAGVVGQVTSSNVASGRIVSGRAYFSSLYVRPHSGTHRVASHAPPRAR